MRPRTLIIHDNLKKEMFYIINIFNDEKIANYQKRFEDIKSELFKLTIQSSIKNLSKVWHKVGAKYFFNDGIEYYWYCRF